MCASSRRPTETCSRRSRSSGFARDLYYRLRVIDLHVPPLRERPEELLALARDLLAQTAARLRRPVVGYTPRALECLLDYPWPGNIRELEHAIERACAVATGPEIDVEDLPDAVRGADASARRPDQRPLADRETCVHPGGAGSPSRRSPAGGRGTRDLALHAEAPTADARTRTP